MNVSSEPTVPFLACVLGLPLLYMDLKAKPKVSTLIGIDRLLFTKPYLTQTLTIQIVKDYTPLLILSKKAAFFWMFRLTQAEENPHIRHFYVEDSFTQELSSKKYRCR